jgi:hypothetical protein
MENQGTCQARYELLATNREVYLERAREGSKLTIPTLIPASGTGKHTNYPTPYQGVGARGVNNLASKLLLSLFPPNSPFFTMRVDDFMADELAQEDGARAKVDEQLGKYERSVMQSIEDSGDRSAHFEALKHLIVGGNVLLYLPKDGGTRVFPLSRYVVTRDAMGEMIECIIEEEMAFASVAEDIRELIADELNAAEADNGPDPKATVKLHTKFYLENDKIKSYQEANGVRVPKSEGTWPKLKPPVIALRWTRIDGEDYGRGYVEEYLGDLISLEGLSKALLEGSAAAARLVFLVRPNGVTRARDVMSAENGAAVSGAMDDVQALQVNKQADMSVAERQIGQLIERLSYAFLMNSAVQRQGERVTAEEVRYMAGELEDALGGVYSILSQEYQLPYVMRVIDRLTKKKKLPSLPDGVAKPTIVTGLEALGRGHDLTKYDMLLKALAPLGPEVLGQYMNVGDYITRIGTALGIDLDGLVKTQEQLEKEQAEAQQQQQQQMMSQMAEKAVPAVAKEGSEAVRQAVQPQEG